MTEPPHHREPAATYRRRRVAAGAAALVVVVLAIVLVTRCGAEVDQLVAGQTGSGTTEPAPDPEGADGSGATDGSGTPDPSAETTTTTVLVIPGFATPQDFLACVKDRESRGDYTAVSPDGMFFGAYQIDQVTWNNTTVHAGLTYLYEVQPNLATPTDQDTLALALLEWQGTSPWAGDC